MRDVQPLASTAVAQVFAGRNLNQVLQATFERNPGLTPQQRALLQDLSYGTLRHYGPLQAILARLLQKPLQDESIRCLLLVALYQLAYTHTQPHAVVDHAVKTTQVLRKTSAKGLVNAVLRNFLRQRERLLSDVRASVTKGVFPTPSGGSTSCAASIRRRGSKSWRPAISILP